MALFDKPHVAVLYSITAIALAIAAGGIALANSAPSAMAVADTVEVTGTATINAKPDTLTVNLTVQVVRPTSNAALTRDNAEMSALQRVFRQGGVPAKDLATSNLTVGKNYNSNGKPSGYIASNSLTATLKDLANAGALISAAQSSVGNDASIDNISYSLENVNGVLNLARAAAIRNARTSADVLAEAANSAVVSVAKITDQSNSTTPIPFNYAAAQKRSAGPATAVPLRPGTQAVTATVDVVFSLSS
ncbi:MAG TPA: SIMPL domain-containing protein [Acidimicrobiales bacterium]|nr:SIMPL domain-containing protein [Acidimicrobiales bacterium]